MNFKQRLASWLVLILVLGPGTPAFAAAPGPQIFIDGVLIQTDTPPVIVDNRVLAPLRAVLEAMGTSVRYDSVTRGVDASMGEQRIYLQVGNSQAAVNDAVVLLDVPATIINGRTMVPLRFVSEAMGAQVHWDAATRSVMVESRSDDAAEPVIPDDQDVITIEYSWLYDEDLQHLALQFNKAQVAWFKGLPRLKTDDYSYYATNPADDGYLTSLGEAFAHIREKQGYTDYESAELAVSFVQSLEYFIDKEVSGDDEYPKYPLETLMDQGGDCEDTSILLAAMLKEMGYGVVLLGCSDHMAVGIQGSETLPGAYFEYDGRRYYYIETTGSGYGIGEIPEAFQETKADIYTVVPKPLITFAGQASGSTLFVTVRNDGTAAAEELAVYAAFDAGGDALYTDAQSSLFSLQPQEEKTVPVKLTVPQAVWTRLMIRVLNHDEVLAGWDSEWFDT
jgi:hypothetical protein